jgi:hypothetical protein
VGTRAAVRCGVQDGTPEDVAVAESQDRERRALEWKTESNHAFVMVDEQLATEFLATAQNDMAGDNTY